jgi:hypothetical protein
MTVRLSTFNVADIKELRAPLELYLLKDSRKGTSNKTDEFFTFIICCYKIFTSERQDMNF